MDDYEQDLETCRLHGWTLDELEEARAFHDSWWATRNDPENWQKMAEDVAAPTDAVRDLRGRGGDSAPRPTLPTQAKRGAGRSVTLLVAPLLRGARQLTYARLGVVRVRRCESAIDSSVFTLKVLLVLFLRSLSHAFILGSLGR